MQNLNLKATLKRLVSLFVIVGVGGICHILLRRRPRNALFMTESPNTKGSALVTSL